MLRIVISCMVALPSLGLSTTSTSSLVRLTQSLSNNSRCESVGFFNTPQLTCASTRRCVALKKPLNFVERLCSENEI